MEQTLFAALGILFLIAIPVAVLVMSIAAFVRSRRVESLSARIEQLEAMIQGPQRPGRLEPAESEATPQRDRPPLESGPLEAEIVPEPARPAQPSTTGRAATRPEPIDWELLVGHRVLGWVAVVLLVLAATFFIRYAVENNWIGPLGRVALAQVAGLALVLGGWYYHRRAWRAFSQMLTAGGVVVLYLSSYAAFGFYQLLPREVAAVFLVVIIVESAILALGYDSLALGLTAVLGGLLTPVLMSSARDQYAELFIYLAVLDLGLVLLMWARSWPAIGTAGLAGTQALFWWWYTWNYHPEKRAWAIGFQAVVYVLFLAHNLGIQLVPRRRVTWEDLARFVLAAIFWFAAFYVLLRDDVDPWMGTSAIVMAAVYAAIAWLVLAAPRRETGHVFTALALSAGFIAIAFPIQAEAAWVALGWAAEGALLWWFGQRIVNLPLRAIGGVLAAAAVLRLLGHDLPPGVRDPFVPVFNSFALPALGVAICILAGLASTRHFLPRRSPVERLLAGAGGAAGVLLLWLVLSLDCYDFFEAQAHLPDAQRDRLLWLGQMALSVLWALYATAVLVVGFRSQRAWLRWLAIGLYGATVAKVFLVDMHELDAFYRIAAFLVLAIFMGLAAWGYRRISPGGVPRLGGP